MAFAALLSTVKIKHLQRQLLRLSAGAFLSTIKKLLLLYILPLQFSCYTNFNTGRQTLSTNDYEIYLGMALRFGDSPMYMPPSFASLRNSLRPSLNKAGSQRIQILCFLHVSLVPQFLVSRNSVRHYQWQHLIHVDI